MAAPAQVRDGVVRLGSSMVSWYLIADEDGVVVLDAGLWRFHDQLRAGLELLGRAPGEIRAVLLTHGDADHTGVAERLRTELGIPVYLHRSDEGLVSGLRPKKTDGSMLAAMLHPGLWRMGAHFMLNGRVPPAKVSQTEPLSDGEELDLPGRPRVIHVPGHTRGHVAFHFPAHRALVVGDSLCTWNPVTGRRGPQLMPAVFNMDTPQALASLARFEGLDASLLLPGHGEIWHGRPAAAVRAARGAFAE